MSTGDAALPVAPRLQGPPPRLLVVRAPYYVQVVDGLTAGALGILAQAGAMSETLDVAGALELPAAVRLAVRAGRLRPERRWDGFVALGCVVKGDTDHYVHVCREAIGGLSAVALRFGLCLGIGVLTVDRVEDALARAGSEGPNKGAEAAVAALLQIRAARWLGAV
jgi:6,7-dimethyl-8-ribityllumazine synthase